jgi:hypothetical protein
MKELAGNLDERNCVQIDEIEACTKMHTLLPIEEERYLMN